MAGAVYGDPKTVGQQAELNAKRLGKEQVALMEEKYEREKQERRAKRAMKLAEKVGGTVDPTPPGTPWWRSGELPGLEKMDKPLDVSKLKDPTHYVLTGEK